MTSIPLISPLLHPRSSISAHLPLPLLLLFLLIFCKDFAVALKCKCTQNSPKVPCENGVCDVPSATSACLMLDHPHSGRHYACSTSDLKEGECVEKQSKSGANVKVCSCHSSDFCNFKIWPDGREEQPFDEEEDDEDDSGDEGEQSEEEDDDGRGARGPANRAATIPPSAFSAALFPLFLFLLSVPMIRRFLSF